MEHGSFRCPDQFSQDPPFLQIKCGLTLGTQEGAWGEVGGKGEECNQLLPAGSPVQPPLTSARPAPLIGHQARHRQGHAKPCRMRRERHRAGFLMFFVADASPRNQRCVSCHVSTTWTNSHKSPKNKFACILSPKELNRSALIK